MPARQRMMLLAIVASIVAITALGWLDARSDDRQALADFSERQAIIARTLADHLLERLTAVHRDAQLIADAHAAASSSTPHALWHTYDGARVRGTLEAADATSRSPTPLALRLSIPTDDARVVELTLRPSTLTATLSHFAAQTTQTLLLLAPGDEELHAFEGHRIALPTVVAALRSQASSIALTPDEAARLGLPRRIAVAGLALVDAGALGTWGVATVVSTQGLRDRQARSRLRLVAGVLTTSTLVATFGVVAFRRQRRELELDRASFEAEHEARLDRAARAATLGTLAMGIAHEIATPASVIQGRAEQLASKHDNDERTKVSLRAIVDQASRITTVTRAFLDMARGNTPASERIEVAELIESAIALVEHRFVKARVNILAPGKRVGVCVRGERRLLEHALSNLLLNACDACRPGGVVEVIVRESGAAAEIDVVDDGAGISPEHLASVTAPFFTTKEPGKGTGLGLAITSEIVRAHRGTLALRSRGGPPGTSAVISLPVDAGDAILQSHGA